MTTERDEALRPCPFCGSSQIESRIAEVGDYWSVYCHQCGAEGSCDEVRYKAIAAWNARQPDPEVVRLLHLLADIPVEAFGKEDKPTYPLMGWNNHKLYVHDVLRARAKLAELSKKGK